MDWNLILTVTLVGIVTVFGALIILSFFVQLYPKLLGKGKSKTIITEIPEKQTIVETKSEPIDDDELIAVITAAISAFSESDYSSKIVVKNIRRVNEKKPIWNNIGRLEALN